MAWWGVHRGGGAEIRAGMNMGKKERKKEKENGKRT